MSSREVHGSTTERRYRMHMADRDPALIGIRRRLADTRLLHEVRIALSRRDVGYEVRVIR